jgi:hypothetical protein
MQKPIFTCKYIAEKESCMKNKIQWIEHKGKKILFCDFSNYTETEYIEGTGLMEKELLKQPRGSKPLLIVDVTNSYMTQATSARGKETVKVLTEADVITKTAMVGIAGIKKIIAQAISRDVYFAKDIESAKEWLVTN